MITELKTKMSEKDDEINDLNASVDSLEIKMSEKDEDIVERD